MKYRYQNFLKFKNEFYQTEYGNNLKKRLDRLIIIGIIGIIFGIILIIFNTNKWDIVTAIILLIASLFFISESITLRISKTNDYILKKK